MRRTTAVARPRCGWSGWRVRARSVAGGQTFRHDPSHSRVVARRWTAAGMLNAERSFRRVKGCKDMPMLMAGLARHVEEVTVTTAA